MNVSHYADRKALLAMRAELERTKLTLAVREIRSVVAPRRNAARIAELRPKAAMFVALVAPFVGLRRFAHIVRFTSYALTAIRVVTHWRR